MKCFCSLFIAICLLSSIFPAQHASAQTAAASADAGDTTLEGTDSLGTLLTQQLQQEQEQADDAQAQAIYRVSASMAPALFTGTGSRCGIILRAM